MCQVYINADTDIHRYTDVHTHVRTHTHMHIHTEAAGQVESSFVYTAALSSPPVVPGDDNGGATTPSKCLLSFYRAMW